MSSDYQVLVCEKDVNYEESLQRFSDYIKADSMLTDIIIDHEGTLENLAWTKDDLHTVCIDRFFERMWDWNSIVAIDHPVIALHTFIYHEIGDKINGKSTY